MITSSFLRCGCFCGNDDANDKGKDDNGEDKGCDCLNFSMVFFDEINDVNDDDDFFVSAVCCFCS